MHVAEKNGTSSVDDDKNGFKDDIYGYNFVANIGKLVPNDHGTHVAGVIAAVNNNGKGVSGIAGGNGKSGSGIRLMSCQIFVDENDPYSENAKHNTCRERRDNKKSESPTRRHRIAR